MPNEAIVVVDATGTRWDGWDTVNMTVDLPAGEQVIGLNFDSNARYALNLNWFELTLN